MQPFEIKSNSYGASKHLSILVRRYEITNSWCGSRIKTIWTQFIHIICSYCTNASGNISECYTQYINYLRSLQNNFWWNYFNHNERATLKFGSPSPYSTLAMATSFTWRTEAAPKKTTKRKLSLLEMQMHLLNYYINNVENKGNEWNERNRRRRSKKEIKKTFETIWQNVQQA